MGPNATYDCIVFELDPQNGLVINVFPVPTANGSTIYDPSAVSFDLSIEKRFLYISGTTDDSNLVVCYFPSYAILTANLLEENQSI